MTGPEIEHCDYLIIGGGVAGCIVARRLADHTRGRVVLIEAGKSDENDPLMNDLSRLDEQTAATDWNYRASPLPGGPPELAYARAKVLGGCANHNDCAFVVPPSSDFEEWERLGAKGWGPAGVAPYFDRVDAMVNVEVPVSDNPVSRAFVAAGVELGLSEVAFRQRIAPGVGWFPLNVRGGRREATSIAYLHPLSQLPRHLEVWTETLARRVMIENCVAVGVETDRGILRANREVILTAGSIGSAQLLLLSGVGPADQLRSLGINVAADLPGVGRHLLDHVAAPVVYDLPTPVPRWRLTPFEATMLLQIDADAPAPDVLFHWGLRVREKYGDRPRLGSPANGVKASPNVARSRSEGEVRLRSSDPGDAPVIELNYLSDAAGYDRRILLSAMKFARRLIETRAFRALGAVEVAPGPDVRSDDELLALLPWRLRDGLPRQWHGGDGRPGRAPHRLRPSPQGQRRPATAGL